MKTLVNFVLFQAGWFACVMGAAQGMYWAPLLSIAVVVAVHLSLATDWRREAVLLAAAGVLGSGVDTALIAAGAYEPVRWLLPAPFTTLWLILMWVNFATALNVSLAWLSGRHVLGVLLGAAGGPMAYYAGERLDALALTRPLTWSLVAVGAAWALAVPLLTGLAARICGPSRAS